MAGEIVFVHLGPASVEYVPHFLKHARQFSPSSRIIFIASAKHPLFKYPWADHAIEPVATEDLAVSDVHRSFMAESTLDVSFRDGFWRRTIERFFVLDSAFSQLGLRNAFHAEYDNLLFFDAKDMAARLAPLYPGLAATFDSHRRAIPGVMYINDPEALSKFAAFIEHRLSAYDDVDARNDMNVLGEFRWTHGRGVVDALPIVTPDYPHALRHGAQVEPADPELYTRNFKAIQSVFDAAAIGQYLYGIDPRNTSTKDTRGFINEEAVFDPSAYRYAIAADERGRLRPFIQSPSGSWPLNNIHVHSKQMLQFSAGPIAVHVGAAPPSPAVPPAARQRKSNVALNTLRKIAVSQRRHDRDIAGVQRQIDDFLLHIPHLLQRNVNFQEQLNALIPQIPTPHAVDLAAFRLNAGPQSVAPNVASALPLDVVVAVAEIDAVTLPYAIEGIRRNFKHPIGRIHLIGSSSAGLPDLAARLGCTFVDEDGVLPLRRRDIDYRINGKDRSGWLFQQFLKLASDTIVGTPHYLVVDADTVLVRPQVFELGGRQVLMHSSEHHAPYFRVCGRLLGWPLESELSCIAHTMLFDSARLTSLKAHLERRFGRSWFEGILSQVNFSDESGFSEFELYGQWCLKRYPLDTVREFWFGANLRGSQLRPAEELERRHGSSHRLVAFHFYSR